MKPILIAVFAALLATLALSAADHEAKKETEKKSTAKAVKPVNLVVNTKADEDEPYVAGNTLYYASNAGGKFSIRMATRSSPLNRWSKGRPVDGIESEVDDRSVYFVSERTGFQYLFFATQHDKETGNFDLYVAQRIDARKSWSAATPVHAACTPEDELHPWITADRKSLYFSRKTKEGWRVFTLTRPTPNGPQFPGEARLVSDLPPGFHHATLTPDGKTMYLQGPLENDRWGLFVSVKTGAAWSKPEPLELLNSPDAPTGDRSPSLSADGMSLYFASDRPGGQGGLDLWVVPTVQLKKN